MSKAGLEQRTTEVCDFVASRMQPSGRTVIAIAGAPASGKSTLAASLVERLNGGSSQEAPRAALLPMDGYHLDNRILEARGLLPRKGAPETFDVIGFCAAVKGLATSGPATYFPSFDRSLDLAVAGSIEILPTTPIIVVEGNYLLLRMEPWNALAEWFTASVFINPGLDVLTRRLNARWLKYGLDPEAAARRAETNDLVNARLVLAESITADLVLNG
ncbi:nucleoside/nucleotide kinase family protein [uncultured Cohaesibacter sp.]|uniref:nucleoside/nucleotide kinase family protein n=1 Tax=uncultured Cohaesibacter sp. TaxID=1002546 RepID=UPI0029C624A9|nr:nucleoside/nucleotide kinase family protein [uncultured Cohaesibacter sp.]